MLMVVYWLWTGYIVDCKLMIFVIFIKFLYCEFIVLKHFYIDMFTDRILGFLTVTGVFFIPNFCFRRFRNTDIIFVFGVTIFNFIFDKKI